MKKKTDISVLRKWVFKITHYFFIFLKWKSIDLKMGRRSKSTFFSRVQYISVYSRMAIKIGIDMKICTKITKLKKKI